MSDPFALCSYGFPKIGAPSDTFEKLAEPVENRLFFAGEHTITKFYGTVHGAYFSGLREAARITQDMDLFEYSTKFRLKRN
jgi:polyamine oxidase